MATYNIHAGHCPQGKGAYGAVGILKESVEDRIVKDEVVRLLRKEGHTVYDCTCDDNTTKDNCLARIVRKCNQHKVDLDISIHLNSGRNDYDGDGSTGGVEVWNYDSRTRAYSDRICANISNELGIRNRGTKYDKKLYVLRNTNSLALLVECCFVDDKDDANRWDAKKCAKAIVEGVLNKTINAVEYGEGVSTKRDMSPGSAHLYCDAPIYDEEWKHVIINGKEGDHITILDHGSSAVLVRHNSTEGIMECKYVMPDIYEGDELELVEDITIILPKGTRMKSLDGGYLGNRVSASFVVESRYVQKIER